MGILLKLQNAFATDIQQLLDGSGDREETLNLHLIELRESYQESLDTRRIVNEEKDKLKVQFNEATTQKDKLEKDFFAALDKLESSKSNDMLNAFIEVSKNQIELKAEYNSLSKISKLFDTALVNMDARIKDIDLNRDALIQGVKVVDIKGSDLELIIQESDLP
jgi:phage shock protein A